MRVVRTAKSITEEHRIKQRRLVQRRPETIDDDEEEFVARCTEAKATYHGRRKETTMFLNRRVRSKDLLRIVNKRREEKEKASIKSVTSVWNRSKPRLIDTIQAFRHKGKGLRSYKKPPKAEDLDNENTHHQRAHIKKMKRMFFSSKHLEGATSYAIIESRDDHAFLRPGTSVGFQGSRVQKVLTPVAEEKSRKLPKYDFPEAKMHCTPGAHRLFTMKGILVDDKEQMVIDRDEHHVFCRPKHYVHSSGTTWANEEMELRHVSTIYDVKTSQYSSQFMQLCRRLRDDSFYYLETNIKQDYTRSNVHEICTTYEKNE